MVITMEAIMLKRSSGKDSISILHYPSLKTVLMVEKVLQEADTPLTREQLKKRLPMKVMHQTLNVILRYLEESGKIIDGRKGIEWTYNPSEKLEAAVQRGLRV